MERFLRVYPPQFSIQFSKYKPDGLTSAPEAAGEAQYGLADLRDGRKLGVMVDLTVTNEEVQRGDGFWGTLYVGTTVDGLLADPVSQPFSGCCTNVEATLSLENPDGEETRLQVRVFANINPQYRPWSEAERRRLRDLEEREDWEAVDAMHRSREVSGLQVYADIRNESLRAGELPDTGELFMLQPTSAATRFDRLYALRVIQDLDHDGFFEQDVVGEVQQAVQAVLIGIDTAWEVHSVSPSGRTVQLLPKRTGVLVGRAVTIGGGPIAGATVKVEPGGFESQTAEDGSFRLEVYEGILWKLLVTKDGFIPYTVRFYSDRQFDLGQDEERILVRAGKETSRTAELFEIPDDKSGTALLRYQGSFYGALGLTFQNHILGDFVFDTWLSHSPEGDRFQGSVCACKEGQRGLVDLGDQGSKPLEDIPIVPFGYTRDYVELREGSVYLVRASEGLEGHFLIFRVLSKKEDGIEVSYLFR